MTTHARFDTMLSLGHELGERRRRLPRRGRLAAALCTGAGTLAWVGDKMGIAAVTPPKNAYGILSFEVLTPPPPPPPPKGVRAAADDPAEDRKPEPQVRPEPPEPTLETIAAPTRPKPRVPPSGSGSGSEAGPKGPRGVPWGTQGGDPRSGCLVPPCLGKTLDLGKPPPIPTRKTEASPVKAPIEAVMATAIYTPDPDPARLARTPTGLTSRRSGRSTVEFCIGGDGRTQRVRTRSRFGGDPEIDRICRQTVGKWRFGPSRVAGKARTTCSTVVFDIRFD
ncbi:MAG: hypothetical protein AAGF11_29765 [Myxococcota bacterium]